MFPEGQAVFLQILMDEVMKMNDSMWELFAKTGLPQVYSYYSRWKRGEGDVSDSQRTDPPQRKL